MYTIAVCDDEKPIAEYIAGAVSERFQRANCPVVMSRFNQAEDLERRLRDGTAYDVMLLDIDMPGKNGIDLCREYRKLGGDALVVFVSGQEALVFQSFDVQPFQYIVQEDGTLSLMESFNRVGCNWAGGYYALCTELLRNEWGFLGGVLSDFNFHDDTGWMNTRSGLRGGTDQWLSIGPSGLLGFVQADVDTAYEIRQACHRILYAVVQTAAMNGMDETSRVVKVTAWWETMLLCCNIAFGILTLLCLIGVIVTRIKAGKENGAGFILGIVASVLAIVGIVGCVMIGGLTKEICLLTLGVVLFAVATKVGSNLLVYLPYACYLGAGCLFLSDEMYTISNVLTAIDANTFSTGFKVAAVGIVGTILVMLIATIFPLKKEQ